MAGIGGSSRGGGKIAASPGRSRRGKYSILGGRRATPVRRTPTTRTRRTPTTRRTTPSMGTRLPPAAAPARAPAAAAPAATSFGGGGFAGGGGAGSGIASNVAQDPNIANWEAKRQERYQQLQDPTDTSRQQGLSATRIAGAAAGQQEQLAEQLAERGVGGGADELGGQLSRGIGEAAQTRQAEAGAQIDINAENQRQQQISQTLGLGSQFAGQQQAGQQAGQGLNIAAFGAQTGRAGMEGGLELGQFQAQTTRGLGEAGVRGRAFEAETSRGLGEAGLANERERLRQQQMGTWASLMAQNA